MTIERRHLGAQVRLEERGEEESPRIEGHAAVFYDGTEDTEFELWRWGNEVAVERIIEGAFDAALERSDDTRALFNHDPSQMLGRSKAGTLDLHTDVRGLAYSIEPGDTTVARDVIEHIRRGDVTGSSFAFVVTEEAWTETKRDDKSVLVVREVRSVELYDVGPVTYPAYTGTDTGLRAAAASPVGREAYQRIWKAWREANPVDPVRRRRAARCLRLAEAQPSTSLS